MDELFTLEDCNDTILKGRSSIIHKLDTSDISTGEFSDVKLDFCIVSHTESSGTHTFTFKVQNSAWNGRYYYMDGNGDYVDSDASYDSSTGTITITSTDDSVTLYLYCCKLMHPFLFERISNLILNNDDYVLSLDDSHSVELHFLKLTDNTTFTRTTTQSEGMNAYGYVKWLCLYKKTDLVFNCTQTLTIGLQNKVYLGVDAKYLPDGVLSNNETLHMTVLFNGTEHTVSFDSTQNDYYFTVDLSGMSTLQKLNFTLVLYESEYVNKGNFEFTLNTQHLTVNSFADLYNSIHTNNISTIQLGADITFARPIPVNSDITIQGKGYALNMKGYNFIIGENVHFKAENLGFAYGDSAIIQKENSIVELNDSLFAFNTSSNYNNLGSCIFCDVDVDSLDVVNDFTTILNNVTFYNNHNCILHGGQLSVDNAIYLNNSVSFADKNNSAFLYQVDGDAIITNSSFDINYDEKDYCTSQKNIGFAQALFKCGETASINNLSHDQYLVNNNTNFFDATYNNKSHIFANYYYPKIGLCVYSSPVPAYEMQSVCYCGSNSDWVYKQNVQITREDWHSENTSNPLGIIEEISCGSKGHVQIGQTLDINSKFNLRYGDKVIPIPFVTISFYDVQEIYTILADSSQSYVGKDSQINLFATVTDYEGDVVKDVVVNFYIEGEEDEEEEEET